MPKTKKPMKNLDAKDIKPQEKTAAPVAPAEAQKSKTSTDKIDKSQASSVADAMPAPGVPANGVRMVVINDVKVAGRLTADPDVKTVGKQNVANFSLAVEKRYVDNKNQWQKQVSFVPVALWGNLAERAKSFLRKGSPVLIEGRLRSSNWQTKDGQNRSTLRVEGFKIQSLAKGQSRSQGAELGL